MVARQRTWGAFILGDKLHGLMFFLPILNKWPLVMNPPVCSNPINGSAAAQWRWGLILLLEKRQTPLVRLRQCSEHWRSCLLSFGRDSTGQPYHTHHPSISCVSLLLQVKGHHLGQHQNGQSAQSCDGELSKVRREASTGLEYCWEVTLALPVPNPGAARCLLRSSGSTFTEWMRNSWFC